MQKMRKICLCIFFVAGLDFPKDNNKFNMGILHRFLSVTSKPLFIAIKLSNNI